MKAVLQRCLSASVTVDSNVVSSINKGILVLAAIGPNDTQTTVESVASKILKMKMWPDSNNAQWKMNVQEIEGEVLCVSQFTLYASTRKGNKPDFHGAAKPDIAKELYDHFLSTIKEAYHPERVKDGVFQAMMQVALVNDGPVTLQIDTDEPKKSSRPQADANESAKSSGFSTPITFSSDVSTLATKCLNGPPKIDEKNGNNSR